MRVPVTQQASHRLDEHCNGKTDHPYSGQVGVLLFAGHEQGNQIWQDQWRDAAYLNINAKPQEIEVKVILPAEFLGHWLSFENTGRRPTGASLRTNFW